MALVGLGLVITACGSSGEGAGVTEEPALGEPPQTAPTTASWHNGQTTAQITALVSGSNVRIVSLRVASVSPLLFDVALVTNTGPDQKQWWWYPGLTAQQVTDQTNANDARVVSLEPYVVGGTTKYAVLLNRNVGADYAQTWWVAGQSVSQIVSAVNTHNARIVDWRQYSNGGTTEYAAVMVANTGAAQTGWWWYPGITPTQIANYLTQNGAYLVSIDPADATGSTFNVVMNQGAPGLSWWWYVGQTAAQVQSLLTTNKARLYDLKSYVVNGTRYYAVLMFGNTWTSAQASDGACDASLVSSWGSMASIPAVGLGSQSAVTSYDAVMTALMNKWGIPGGAVAVMNQGKLVLARGYGESDQQNAQLAHPDSLFRVASVTKQITSAAILTLVQQGKLKLTDKAFSLLNYTPNPAGTQTSTLASITIQQLLTHTGGWSPDTCTTNCTTEGDPMFQSIDIRNAQNDSAPPSCDKIIQDMLTRPVRWTPGTVSDYSNFGYCVLGAVVEKVGGPNYGDWVTANVLGPAGASGIVQGHTLQQADHEVVYYDFPGAGTDNDVFAPSLAAYSEPYGGFYLEAMASHGAWVASPIDLLRFQGALDGRTGGTPLLTSSSITSMTANPNVKSAGVDKTGTLVVSPPSSTSWYGFGWAVNSGGNWWHNGSLPGTTAEQIHTNNGWGFAVTFNSRPSDWATFNNEVDSALWNAFNGTTTWLTTNLFDQYGTYTGWMTASAYQAYFNTQVQAGKYPSRVEGASVAGIPLYRASFVTAHTPTWHSSNGIDCNTYKSQAQTYTSQGYETSSLQSYVSTDGTRRYQATWVKM
jgi:CubicO group peptidase (beta-lactamase class C family)